MSDDTKDHTEEHPHAGRIRERAYLIWEGDGRPDGHALAHWVRARQEIEAEVAGEQEGDAPSKA
ncbi:DUF2934 domain-containing protein [Aestuariivirga sp.]|uniref:DUF2934 domain-containing protein n=1 Tax=Aestuariivirga sp. TaxID=2650926 RepID=UPI0025BC9A3C|nr:DUF2934 domain-containing protein [Aestuariivirga sp.]MCA3556479.1 DUF2934 domain-containing protein [Aestuariivirga sp.]